MRKLNVLTRRFIMVVTLLSCLGSLSAQNKEELISIARQAGMQAAFQMMKEISPNTGKEHDYDLDYESVIYDPYAKEIECKVVTSWSAKEYMLSFKRDICKVWGKLYIDLSQGKNKIKTRFIPKGKNAHAEACARSHWASVAAGITFYIVSQ